MQCFELTSYAVRTPTPNVENIVTPYFGDSNQLRNSDGCLIRAWGDVASAARVIIRSPKFGDNIVGLGFSMNGGQTFDAFNSDFLLHKMFRGDVLTLAINPTQAQDQGFFLYTHYDDLQDVKTSYIGYEECKARFTGIYRTARTDHSNTAVVNPIAYQNAVILNSTDNVFFHGHKYALIGYNSPNFGLGAVTWRGIFTGNFRIGGDGDLTVLEKQNYFLRLAQRTGYACIPVMDGDDAATTVVEVATVAAGFNDLFVTSIFAEVAP